MVKKLLSMLNTVSTKVLLRYSKCHYFIISRFFILNVIPCNALKGPHCIVIVPDMLSNLILVVHDQLDLGIVIACNIVVYASLRFVNDSSYIYAFDVVWLITFCHKTVLLAIRVYIKIKCRISYEWGCNTQNY